MDTPVNAASSPIEPTLQPNSVRTIGVEQASGIDYLASFKKSASTHSLYERLQLLTSRENTELISAFLALVSKRQNLAILDSWSEESSIARELHKVGIQIWRQPGLTMDLELVKTNQRIKQHFQGLNLTQYLAVMASSRRFFGDEPLANFVEKLQLLLLIRSLEALEKNHAVWEVHVRDVSLLLRKVLDVQADTRADWLRRASSNASEFDDFCNEVSTNAYFEADKTTHKNQKAFFRSLRVVADGGPWNAKKLIKDLPGDANLVITPFPLRPIAQPATSFFEDWDGNFAERHLSDHKGKGLRVSVTRANPKQSPSRNRRHGTGVMLQFVEDVQYLRNSWYHLSSAEQAEFDRWIHQLGELPSADHLDKLGAAIAQIAVVSCRTAHQIETLKISSAVDDDWSLHPTTCKMQRKPPRFAQGWVSDPSRLDTAGWINSQLDQWTVSLWQPFADALGSAISRNRNAATIGQLWKTVCPTKSFENWFNEKVTQEPHLQRLSGPTLSQIAATRAFEANPNQGLIRLISSQPRTGLPSACAYGAYQAPVVKATLTAALASTIPPLLEVESPTADSQLNAGGSFLDINLEKVATEISTLIQSVNRLASEPASWARYHNKLTSLVVIALYASTGGRPVNSPFQTLSWFSFKRMLLYIEDKVSGPTRSSRICVLSDVAAKLLQEAHLPHLVALARFLEPSAPEFANQIQRVAAGDPEAAIPLFFFLKDSPELDWVEVSETQLALESEITWPLPWNLFRHIHATELIRRGLDAEIVDALLGHGDRGAESHGDLSLRVPQSDIAAARPIINDLQSELRFDLPAALINFPIGVKYAHKDLLIGRSFGRSARRIQRLQAQEAARKRARQEIVAAIANRPPDSLSPDQWEEIARSMLLRQDGLPHSAASMRYEEFENYVESLWQNQRKLTRMRRIYSVAPEPEAIFSEACIAAPEVIQLCMDEHELAVQKVTDKQLNATLAATLAALDLILYSKVSNGSAIKSLILLRKSFKIVKLDQKYWFEWSDADVWRDGRPVLRVQMTARAARWATTAQAEGRSIHKFPSVPKALTQLDRAFGANQDLQRLMKHLCKMQNQLNAWNLPGTDSAHLSGRLTNSALPHADWYRAKMGKAPVLVYPEETYDTLSTDEIYFIEGHHKAVDSLAGQSTPESCAKVFDEIRLILHSDKRDIDEKRRAVERKLRVSGYGRADVPFVFGMFLLHLLTRKAKRGSRDGLRARTVDRYFQSINQPLCDEAHDLCFTDMDGDEITDVYIDMLDWWDHHFVAPPPQAEKPDTKESESAPVVEGTTVESNEVEKPDTNHAQAEKETKGTKKSRLSARESADDAARRTLLQLHEFHAFAARTVGADEPDWSQITNGNIGSIGRPGFISLREYRLALKSMVGSRQIEMLEDSDLADYFSMFACARFGLRVGEAAGLFTNDWTEHRGAIVMLVRPNSLRPLKTANSRRPVPLIGLLDETERLLVDEILRRSRHRLRVGEVGPLLPGIDRQNFKAKKHDIGIAIRAALKVATCHEFCTAHMLRHSFATRTLATLRGIAVAQNEPVSEEDILKLRRLLLGKDELDRRVLWAVARLLGHKGPRITARCYLHAMEGATSLYREIGSWDSLGAGARHLVNLDLVATSESYGKVSKLPSGNFTKGDPPLLRLVKCWRLIVQGYDIDAALRDSCLSRNIFDEFVKASSFLKHDAPKSSSPPTDAETDERPAAESDSSTSSPVDDLVSALTSSALPNWRITLAQFDGLIDMLRDKSSSPTAENKSFQVGETIGARRQIILFSSVHLEAASRFFKDIDIDEKDIVLTGTRELTDLQRTWIQSEDIHKYVATPGTLPDQFRIDKATIHDGQFDVLRRVALLPQSMGSRLANRYVLLFLWVGWCICSIRGDDSQNEQLSLLLQ